MRCVKCTAGCERRLTSPRSRWRRSAPSTRRQETPLLYCWGHCAALTGHPRNEDRALSSPIGSTSAQSHSRHRAIGPGPLDDGAPDRGLACHGSRGAGYGEAAPPRRRLLDVLAASTTKELSPQGLWTARLIRRPPIHAVITVTSRDQVRIAQTGRTDADRPVSRTPNGNGAGQRVHPRSGVP